MFSFVFEISGVNALLADKVNFVGFVLPKKKQIVSVNNKNKSDNSFQILNVIGTSANRNFEYLVHDDAFADASYTTVVVNSNEKYWAMGKQFSTVSSMYQAIVFAGTKDLKLQAKGYFLNDTSLSGVWWLSQEDWEFVEGYTLGTDYYYASDGEIIFN